MQYSFCPLMLEPKRRDISREAWRWLWRQSRVIWRDNHKKYEKALVDLVIYGHAELEVG
jgi:hypothetical protein